MDGEFLDGPIELYHGPQEADFIEAESGNGDQEQEGMSMEDLLRSALPRLKGENLDAAESIMENPGNVEALTKLGQALSFGDMYPIAERLLQKVVELQPKNPNAYGELANMYSGMSGRRMEFIEHLRKSVELGGDGEGCFLLAQSVEQESPFEAIGLYRKFLDSSRPEFNSPVSSKVSELNYERDRARAEQKIKELAGKVTVKKT